MISTNAFYKTNIIARAKKKKQNRKNRILDKFEVIFRQNLKFYTNDKNENLRPQWNSYMR